VAGPLETRFPQMG